MPNSSQLQCNTYFHYVNKTVFLSFDLVNVEFKNSISLPWSTDIVCRNKQKRHYCVPFSLHCV